MAEGSWDAKAIVEANYQSPVFGRSVNTISVTPQETLLLPFNGIRAFCVIQNSGSTLYVKFGTGATIDDYSFRLSPNAFASIDKWGGAITAVRVAETYNVQVTEVY